ncbi:MAG: hypothetical protein ACE5O2_00240 [Armatimonadota bacterium]
MTRHHPLAKFAYGLGGVFVFVLAAPLLASPGTQSGPTKAVRVAVTECTDLSRGRLGHIDRMAREALCLALSASGRYEVVPDADEAERLLVAAVQAVPVGSKSPRVSVSLATEARDPVTGRTVYHGLGRAVTGGRGQGEVSRTALLQAAVDRAAQAVVTQMKKAEDIRGVVLETLTRGRARVNIGRNAGIVPGTVFDVYKHGKHVATLKAKDISANDTNCYITEQVSGVRLAAGDEVRVVLIPEKVKEAKHRKSKKTAIIFGVLAAAGLTYMLVDNSWKGDRPPKRIVQSVTADPETIDGDGSDESLITAVVLDKDGKLVKDGALVTFQIDGSLSTGPGTLKNSDGVKASLVVEPTTNGVATVILTSELPTDGADAVVFVRATSGTGTAISPAITVVAPTSGT